MRVTGEGAERVTETGYRASGEVATLSECPDVRARSRDRTRPPGWADSSGAHSASSHHQSSSCHDGGTPKAQLRSPLIWQKMK